MELTAMSVVQTRLAGYGPTLFAGLAFMPGTKVDDEIADVIAYLKTFDAEGKASVQ